MKNGSSVLVVLASLALAGAAHAQSPQGEAQLAGSEQFAAKGCGRSGTPVALDFAIEPLVCAASILPCPDDGSWSLDGAAAPLTGLSKGGRRGARLSLHGSALSALETALEAKAAEQCGEPIDLSGLAARGVLLISKDQTRARLRLTGVARASSAGGEATRAFYRIRARGNWTPALSQ